MRFNSHDFNKTTQSPVIVCPFRVGCTCEVGWRNKVTTGCWRQDATAEQSKPCIYRSKCNNKCHAPFHDHREAISGYVRLVGQLCTHRRRDYYPVVKCKLLPIQELADLTRVPLRCMLYSNSQANKLRPRPQYWRHVKVRLHLVSCPDYFSPFFRLARKMRSGNETRLHQHEQGLSILVMQILG